MYGEKVSNDAKATVNTVANEVMVSARMLH